MTDHDGERPPKTNWLKLPVNPRHDTTGQRALRVLVILACLCLLFHNQVWSFVHCGNFSGTCEVQYTYYYTTP